MDITPQFNSSRPVGMNNFFTGAGAVFSAAAAVGAVACIGLTAGLCAVPVLLGTAAVGAGLALVGELVDDGPAPNITNIQNNYVQEISGTNNCGFMGTGVQSCNKASIHVVNNQESIDITNVNINSQQRTPANSGTRYAINGQGHLTSQPVYYSSWPSQFTPTTTVSQGSERGGGTNNYKYPI
jgi:hypothetical protein